MGPRMALNINCAPFGTLRPHRGREKDAIEMLIDGGQRRAPGPSLLLGPIRDAQSPLAYKEHRSLRHWLPSMMIGPLFARHLHIDLVIVPRGFRTRVGWIIATHGRGTMTRCSSSHCIRLDWTAHGDPQLAAGCQSRPTSQSTPINHFDD